MLKPDDIDINSATSSSAIVEAIPQDLKSFVISLPSSLVCLSLENNNLSNKSFSVDFNSLSMLKDLYIGGNPIISLPNCVRTLPRLETLSVKDCRLLRIIEHPPRSLRLLYFNMCHRIKKIIFDLEMSPLKIRVPVFQSRHPLHEVEGAFKIQPMIHVKKDVIRSLGWANLEFMKHQQTGKTFTMEGKKTRPFQMYYEFGIFSTFYWGKEIPNWISHRSKGSSISFTIPSSPNSLKGLNFCYAQMCPSQNNDIRLPLIRISNITKNHTWIYDHCSTWINDHIDEYYVAEESVIFVSDWMFGKYEMEGGDQVSITVRQQPNELTRECGISLVYDDENTKEDPLGYYKSWNHIVGGDLSPFRLTTGEYLLYTMRFFLSVPHDIVSDYHPFIQDGACFEENDARLRAFSQRKSNTVGGAPEVLSDKPKPLLTSHK